MSKKDIFKDLTVKKVILLAVMCVLTIVCMVTIFKFSSQSSHESTTHSESVTYRLVKLIAPDYEKPDKYNADDLYYKVNSVVRKTGHFLVYALLGFLTYFTANCVIHVFKMRFDAVKASIAAGAVCGAMDEIHQLFVEGRCARVTDVVIDFAGVAFGVFVAVSVAKAFVRCSGKTFGGEVEK